MSWKKSSFSAAHFSNSGKRTKKWSRTSRFTGAIAGVLSRAFGAVGDEGATSGPHLRPSLIPHLSAGLFWQNNLFAINLFAILQAQNNLFAILLAQNNLFAILLAKQPIRYSAGTKQPIRYPAGKKPIRYSAGKTTYWLFCWQNNLFAILLAKQPIRYSAGNLFAILLAIQPLQGKTPLMEENIKKCSVSSRGIEPFDL